MTWVLSHLFNQVKFAFSLGKKFFSTQQWTVYTKSATITMEKERRSSYLTVVSKSSHKRRTKQFKSSFAFLDCRNVSKYSWMPELDRTFVNGYSSA